MKILVVAHKPPYPPVDGGTLATLNMCLGLAKSGNSVSVLTLSTSKHPGSLERIPRNIQALIDFEIFHIHLSTNILNNIFNIFFSRKPYNIQRYSNPIFRKLLKKKLKENNFDIIQLEGLYLTPYIKAMRQVFDGPIVMRAHNVEHHIWEGLAEEENNLFKTIYFKLLSKRLAELEKTIYKKVDALVAISEPDREWFLQNNFSKPSLTIAAGYFSNVKVARVEQVDFPAICYIGALDWLPNTEGLLWFIDWVWPRIQSEIPAIEMHIAGRNAPETLADRLMVERNIIFHGQVADSAEFLSRCPIMIVPLLSGSGIRVKIIEGMFLQRAIVSTNIGAKGLNAINEEHILIADTPEEFALSVCKLIKSEELVHTLAQNAQKFAHDNYDAVNLAVKLTQFYKELS